MSSLSTTMFSLYQKHKILHVRYLPFVYQKSFQSFCSYCLKNTMEWSSSMVYVFFSRVSVPGLPATLLEPALLHLVSTIDLHIVKKHCPYQQFCLQYRRWCLIDSVSCSRTYHLLFISYFLVKSGWAWFSVSSSNAKFFYVLPCLTRIW